MSGKDTKNPKLKGNTEMKVADKTALEMICGIIRPFAPNVTEKKLQGFITTLAKPGLSKVMTAKQAGAAIGLSRSSVSRLCRDGVLKGYKNGAERSSKLLVSLESVERYQRKMRKLAKGKAQLNEELQ